MFDGIGRAVNGAVERFALARGERLRTWSTMLRPPAAAPMPTRRRGTAGGAEVLDDGFHAVLAAGGAVFAQAQLAERQREVVVHDQRLGGVDLVELRRRAHRRARWRSCTSWA